MTTDTAIALFNEMDDENQDELRAKGEDRMRPWVEDRMRRAGIEL